MISNGISNEADFVLPNPKEEEQFDLVSSANKFKLKMGHYFQSECSECEFRTFFTSNKRLKVRFSIEIKMSVRVNLGVKTLPVKNA